MKAAWGVDLGAYEGRNTTGTSFGRRTPKDSVPPLSPTDPYPGLHYPGLHPGDRRLRPGSSVN